MVKKKNRMIESSSTVVIDAEQMEYLKYRNKLTGHPIAAILQDIIAQWVAVEYATRVPSA
jgi:hypothetical protein